MSSTMFMDTQPPQEVKKVFNSGLDDKYVSTIVWSPSHTRQLKLLHRNPPSWLRSSHLQDGTAWSSMFTHHFRNRALQPFLPFGTRSAILYTTNVQDGPCTCLGTQMPMLATRHRLPLATTFLPLKIALARFFMNGFLNTACGLLLHFLPINLAIPLALWLLAMVHTIVLIMFACHMTASKMSRHGSMTQLILLFKKLTACQFCANGLPRSASESIPTTHRPHLVLQGNKHKQHYRLRTCNINFMVPSRSPIGKPQYMIKPSCLQIPQNRPSPLSRGLLRPFGKGISHKIPKSLYVLSAQPSTSSSFFTARVIPPVACLFPGLDSSSKCLSQSSITWATWSADPQTGRAYCHQDTSVAHPLLQGSKSHSPWGCVVFHQPCPPTWPSIHWRRIGRTLGKGQGSFTQTCQKTTAAANGHWSWSPSSLREARSRWSSWMANIAANLPRAAAISLSDAWTTLHIPPGASHSHRSWTLLSQTGHRAPGPDGIPGEVCRLGAVAVGPALHNLYLKSVLEASEPCVYKGGQLCVIHNGKGPVHEASSYRGILLSNTYAKVLHAWARNKLLPTYQVRAEPGQLGGLPSKQTATASHILRLHETAGARKKLSTAILFLDVRSAFHHMLREWVFSIANQWTRKSLAALFDPDIYDPQRMMQLLDEACIQEVIDMPPQLRRLLHDVHQRTWFQTRTGTILKRLSPPPSVVPDRVARLPTSVSTYWSVACSRTSLSILSVIHSKYRPNRCYYRVRSTRPPEAPVITKLPNVRRLPSYRSHAGPLRATPHQRERSLLLMQIFHLKQPNRSEKIILIKKVNSLT